MKYRALVSFSGVVSAPAKAEVEITDEVIAEDQLKAGYIESLEGYDADNADDDADTKKKYTKSTKKEKDKYGEQS